MSKETCADYERQYTERTQRLNDLETNGFRALSPIDVKLNQNDPQRAMEQAKFLLGNQVRSLQEKVDVCRKTPQQITLWEQGD